MSLKKYVIKKIIILVPLIVCMVFSFSFGVYAAGFRNDESSSVSSNRALSAVVRNRYYSTYTPLIFDVSSSSGSNISNYNLRKRMNCYGYAFRFIYYSSIANLNPQLYYQHPGEFAKTSDKGNVMRLYNYVNPSDMMAAVVNNMGLDASRLGYTITEYTPSGSTVPQFGSSNRLIAVVAVEDAFHFYMQHSDGKWSHKNGVSAVSDISLSSGSVLTNSNIKTKALEGYYSGGVLKFFLITQDAVIDHPHAEKCCEYWPCNHSQSSLFYLEKAGQINKGASNIYTGTTSARIDFPDDVDWFCFTASSSGSYLITTTSVNGADIDCLVSNNNGTIIASDTSIGQVSLSVSMTSGSTYYISFSNEDRTYGLYYITINKQ